jgi:tRNA threonylcarbamoyladenosine biosynthesis protein TsaB
MRFIILETSGRVGQVALAEDARIIDVRRLDETRRHARDLAPSVAQLLAKLGWKPTHITAIIVSTGPGSYTGLRVGIMSAKTFCYATAAALVGVETFKTLALQAAAEALPVTVLADAQQERVYIQTFDRGGQTGVQAAAPLRIEPITTWLASDRPTALITGPGLHRYRDRLDRATPVAREELWDPRVESLLEIGKARYELGDRDSLWSVEPLYLRPSAAEQQWQALGRK